MCSLLAVLGSQGVVVACTAAIFFRTVDCIFIYIYMQMTTIFFFDDI